MASAVSCSGLRVPEGYNRRQADMGKVGMGRDACRGEQGQSGRRGVSSGTIGAHVRGRSGQFEHPVLGDMPSERRWDGSPSGLVSILVLVPIACAKGRPWKARGTRASRAQHDVLVSTG